jgi:cytochrome P450
MTVAAPRIDLLSPAVFASGHPHEQYRWLREHDPVHFHPEPDGPGFWAVTRYADVHTVSRDTSTYSSYERGVMIADPQPEALDGVRQMMLYMDPPQHTRYRRLVSRAFTPRTAESWRERIDRAADRIVDAVIEDGECDLVTALAGEMPSYVVAELMGIPLEDSRRLYHLTEVMHSADSTISDDDRMNAVIEMHMYATQTLEAKRGGAGDIVGLLAQSEMDGDRLTVDEFNWFFLLLVNAGGDTTRNLIGAGLQVLFAHPAERARLAADLDGLMPTAVEELLRYVSPVVHMRRTATQDTELGGQRIRARDKVVVFYGSANRDETVFAQPDRLDLGRSPNPHVAFGGGGAHFCLGAHFARLEVAAMLRAVLTRMPDLEPIGEAEPLVSNFIHGPRHLPVRFTPRPRLA